MGAFWVAASSRALSRLRRKLTVEVLWIYVLAALAARGPTYAYDVRRAIDEIFGFKPRTVTLYTVIYRLEREGLISKKGSVYEVTREGWRILKEGLCFLHEATRKLEQAAGLENLECAGLT
jgi:PadR family transcriptional regulator PadR